MLLKGKTKKNTILSYEFNKTYMGLIWDENYKTLLKDVKIDF